MSIRTWDLSEQIGESIDLIAILMTLRSKNHRKTSNQKINYWIELIARICVISRFYRRKGRETNSIIQNSQTRGRSRPRTNWARVRHQFSIRSLTKISRSTSWARLTSRSSSASRTSKIVRRCKLHRWSRTPRTAHKSNPRTWKYNIFRLSHKITPSLRTRIYCSVHWRRRRRAARTTSSTQACTTASKNLCPWRTPIKKISLTR